MKFNDVYLFFHQMRGVLLLTAFIWIIIFTITCNAHVFDCEGPSGEAMQAEQDYRNRENEKAYDRCRERDRDTNRENENRNDSSNDNSRDRDRADNYLRENVV